MVSSSVDRMGRQFVMIETMSSERGSVNVSAEVIPAAGDRKTAKGMNLFVDPEPARIGSLLIAVSLLAALCILDLSGRITTRLEGLQEIGIGIRNMEIHGFVIIVGYQDDGIRVGGQHGQHGADSAVAGKKLAKFAGFIDDKGLVESCLSSSSRNMTRIISE